MTMEKEQPEFKILMFPWLAHGHIFPFLELSERLSERNLTIYLCSTPINLDSIKNSISEKEPSSIKLVELHMPSSPDLPPHLHTTKNLPSDLIARLIQAFQGSKSSFSEILDCVEPDLLIYDSLQPWAPKIASSKGIPSVYFATTGATPFAYFHHLYTYKTGSNFPYKEICITDLEIFSKRDRIVDLVEDADADEFAFGNFSLSSEIVLIKSCRAVEGKYIDYLSVLSKKRIVPTGPLLANEINYENEECLEIMKWLSGKNKASTVYISFGSEYFLSKDQIAEVARGLQLCDANFLWVIRFSAEETETRRIENELPEGFFETMRDRGKIITGWAPQAKILAHSSVGGFVSHCGWSSITESMYFGVPVIAMPMKSDQPLNARMTVGFGVGVEVEKGGDGRYVGEEIAKAIRKVIECEDMMKRAEELSGKIKDEEGKEVKGAEEEVLRILKSRGGNVILNS